MPQSPATPTEIHAAVAPLTAAPERSAAFFDLDGTLAPIVGRPDDVAVPDRTRELLARIGERYAMAGIVSGRQAAAARRIAALEGLTFVGNHGFEVLRPGAEAPEPAPALAGHERVAAEFASGLAPERLERVGLRTEDKAAIVALHWRGAADEERAAAVAEEIAAEAAAAGLHLHRGRKVLELRPPVDLDKGAGLVSVLRGSGLDSAFYAGDDRTDIDGFRGLGELVDDGELERAVRVAVVSEETPAEVAEAADLVVEGPDGFVPVLEALA